MPEKHCDGNKLHMGRLPGCPALLGQIEKTSEIAKIDTKKEYVKVQYRPLIFFSLTICAAYQIDDLSETLLTFGLLESYLAFLTCLTHTSWYSGSPTKFAQILFRSSLLASEHPAHWDMTTGYYVGWSCSAILISTIQGLLFRTFRTQGCLPLAVFTLPFVTEKTNPMTFKYVAVIIALDCFRFIASMHLIESNRPLPSCHEPSPLGLGFRLISNALAQGAGVLALAYDKEYTVLGIPGMRFKKTDFVGGLPVEQLQIQDKGFFSSCVKKKGRQSKRRLLFEFEEIIEARLQGHGEITYCFSFIFSSRRVKDCCSECRPEYFMQRYVHLMAFRLRALSTLGHHPDVSQYEGKSGVLRSSSAVMHFLSIQDTEHQGPQYSKFMELCTALCLHLNTQWLTLSDLINCPVMRLLKQIKCPNHLLDGDGRQNRAFAFLSDIAEEFADGFFLIALNSYSSASSTAEVKYTLLYAAFAQCRFCLLFGIRQRYDTNSEKRRSGRSQKPDFGQHVQGVSISLASTWTKCIPAKL
ncbi:hypothetical protein GQR58_013353 [Nymphon striatum]|nr:hypothetical protein GQR58_013353 [Nymphon striatum]